MALRCGYQINNDKQTVGRGTRKNQNQCTEFSERCISIVHQYAGLTVYLGDFVCMFPWKRVFSTEILNVYIYIQIIWYNMPRQVGHVRPCETIWNNDLKFVSAGWCRNFTALNTSSHPAPLKSKVAVGAMLQECLRPLKSNAKERLMNRRTHKVWRVEQMNPHVHQLLQTVRQPYVTLTIFVSTLYTICQKKGSDFAVWKSPFTSNKIFRGSPSNFNIL